MLPVSPSHHNAQAENPPPRKYRRVDEDESGAKLIFVPQLGLVIDDTGMTGPLPRPTALRPPPYLANDLLELCFVDAAKGKKGTTGNDDLLFSGPTFTHQLFDDELFDFLEPRLEPVDLTTLLIFRLNDLRCRVILPRGLSPRETELLREGLLRGVPADTEFVNHTDEVEDCVDDFAQAGKPLTVRVGNSIHTFVSSRGESFEIWLASAKDAGCSEVWKRFEKVAVMFIETADGVDFSGDDRWQCLWLAKCNRDSSFSLVGYYTLFSFRNPYAGTRLRICQALILPPYQGQGLGRQLLAATYRMAQRNAEVVEVTVEDPAPGFQQLRDAIDFEWCTTLHPKITRAGVALLNDSTSVTSKAREVAAELKLTSSQVQAVIEAVQLHALRSTLDAHAGADGAAMASFRLRVKRRLLAENPDLRTRPKAEMQTELDELYEEQLQRLERLDKHVSRIKV